MHVIFNKSESFPKSNVSVPISTTVAVLFAPFAFDLDLIQGLLVHHPIRDSPRTGDVIFGRTDCDGTWVSSFVDPGYYGRFISWYGMRADIMDRVNPSIANAPIKDTL